MNRCVRFNRGFRRLEGGGPAEYKDALDAFKHERDELPDSAFALIEYKQDKRFKDGRTKKIRKYPRVPRKTQISSYARAKQLGLDRLAGDIFEVKDAPAPPSSPVVPLRAAMMLHESDSDSDATEDELPPVNPRVRPQRRPKKKPQRRPAKAKKKKLYWRK